MTPLMSDEGGRQESEQLYEPGEYSEILPSPLSHDPDGFINRLTHVDNLMGSLGHTRWIVWAWKENVSTHQNPPDIIPRLQSLFELLQHRNWISL